MKVTVVISVWRGVFNEAKAFRNFEVAQKYAEILKKESGSQDFDVTVTTIDISNLRKII